MDTHEQYMNDFMEIFRPLHRWGPGSEADTRLAFSHVGFVPERIVDIGCGKGLSTIILAEETDADIVAVDTEASALEDVARRFSAAGLDARLTVACLSMADLPSDMGRFDLLWSEASVYVIGFAKAIGVWKPLLTDSGVMVISDLVWRTDSPNLESKAFWAEEYPDMKQVDIRLQEIREAGLECVFHFSQSPEGWDSYYEPLGIRLQELQEKMGSSPAYVDIKREVDLCTRMRSEFGYHFFVLKPKS